MFAFNVCKIVSVLLMIFMCSTTETCGQPQEEIAKAVSFFMAVPAERNEARAA